MRVRVLGPFELSISSVPSPRSAGRLRALLAALVVRHGGLVSTDQLVEELWPRQAPATAVNLIHQYVARLRRAMGEDGATFLRSQSHGYRLVFPDGVLDAQEFESVVATGLVKLGEGDQEGGAAALGQALALWRGPAFCDVPMSPAVEAEAARLEELRLDALESRIEAELALGRHTTLAAELRALTEEHPLREGFWGLLMLTLYRCGRQAEALEAYRLLYRLLDDELGIEPTQRLREAHQQMLNGGPVHLSSAPVRTPVEGVAPRQLPPAISGFAGRRVALSQLDALLSPNAGEAPTAMVISVVAGMPGVGKTTLAIHWAHQVADRFPDGQLYVNLRGFDPRGQPLIASDAVRGFLEALQVPPQRIPTTVDAQIGLYRSLLAGRRVLIMLDNARDAEHVRSLLPGGTGCLVLVTSRDRLTDLVVSHSARLVTLDLLDTDEARELFELRIGRDRVAAEPETVRDLIHLCARLPLALAIVAARAAVSPGLPLTRLIAELHSSPDGLDTFGDGDNATDLRGVFSWSYRRLGPRAARLFRLLGLHPGPEISVPAAASLAAIPVHQARSLLAGLTAAHLVAEHRPGRYTLHDLMRAYTFEIVHTDDSETERQAAVHRMLDHYLHTACGAARLLHPQYDPITIAAAQPGVIPEELNGHDDAMSWFTAEHTVLLTVLDQAVRRGYDTHVWQLAWSLQLFLSWRGHYRDLAATQQAALDATRRLGDRTEETRAVAGVASAYAQLGDLDQAEAWLGRALDLCDQRNDPIRAADIHGRLSGVQWRRGRPATALASSKRAFELYKAAGHQGGQASSLNDIGWYHAELGDYQQAVVSCEESLALFRKLGRTPGEASASDSLGYAHHHLGQYAQAMEYYRHALNLYQDLDRGYGQALTLTHLGDTQHVIGDHDAARESWSQALTNLEDLHHPEAHQIRAKLQQLHTHSRHQGQAR